MRKHHRFTPTHPAVCPLLKSRLLWAEMTPTHVGGRLVPQSFFKAKFNTFNESPVLALIATDFQIKN